MAMLAVIACAFSILVFSAISTPIPLAAGGLLEPGRRAHRESE